MPSSLLNRILSRLTGSPTGTRAERAITHFERGAEHAASEKHPAASREFKKAIKLSPGTPDLYHHLGSSLARQGKHREAIGNYDLYLQLADDNPEVLLDRGNSHHQLGDLDAAIRDYSRAIFMRHGWAEAHANRAAVYAQAGNEESAQQDADEAIRLGVDPDTIDHMLQAAREERDHQT